MAQFMNHLSFEYLINIDSKSDKKIRLAGC